MDIQSNINRIHSNLNSKFKNVEIFEKSSLKFGNYFEIKVNESKVVRIIIPYKNLEKKIFINWVYYANPLDENSSLVERDGTIQNIPNQIADIIDNNRFSEEYLQNNSK